MKLQSRLLVAAMALLLFVFGCTCPATQQADKNKQLFMQGAEAINERNWDALDELIALDYVRHCQATPEVEVSSLEEFKQFLIQDAATFPDSRMTIEHIVAEGDMVAFYGTYVGTQKEQMGPFPPSNKQMSVDFSGIHRFENGKLAETWLTWDNVAALAQLGHLPPPPQGNK